MSSESQPIENPSELAARAIRDQLAAGAPVALLDVREPAERAFASIPVPEGVVDLFVPMREVSTRLDEIREALAHGPLVVYCHHGVRSMAVARWLAAQGLGPIVNLGGGIDAWSIEVDPGVPRYF
ncbi:rhodanese-like domain-containing protein [Paludisphaera borealis]|uniref:Putative adenylyltransferase/sulfurtransferase MoeZ n=1 Tax=Paludisphaera borealis TaxID=1387353 RepID=A0A1U7CKZ3_9BACT|nr:rhodanese-like domain-containing protein [Paludisphaera borealis]APW59610.1 putative adenylyltransferase/sulfurtransferase MoeZ [Paludisphaera borealis]